MNAWDELAKKLLDLCSQLPDCRWFQVSANFQSDAMARQLAALELERLDQTERAALLSLERGRIATSDIQEQQLLFRFLHTASCLALILGGSECVVDVHGQSAPWLLRATRRALRLKLPPPPIVEHGREGGG